MPHAVQKLLRSGTGPDGRAPAVTLKAGYNLNSFAVFHTESLPFVQKLNY
jgi:hypothetical protein